MIPGRFIRASASICNLTTIPLRKFHLVFIECNIGGRHLLISSPWQLPKGNKLMHDRCGCLLYSSLSFCELAIKLFIERHLCVFLFFGNAIVIAYECSISNGKRIFYRFDIFVTYGLLLQDIFDINTNYCSGLLVFCAWILQYIKVEVDFLNFQELKFISLSTTFRKSFKVANKKWFLVWIETDWWHITAFVCNLSISFQVMRFCFPSTIR